MLGILAGVLGAQWVLTGATEWFFHRKRRVVTAERRFRPLTSLLLTSLAALIVFFEKESPWSLVFSGLAALSVVTFAWEAHGRAAGGAVERPMEAWLHAWGAMLHVLTLIVLGATWPFIHGVSIFMGIVLPFSTSGLWEVGVTYLGASAALTVYLGVRYWILARASWKKAPVVAVPGVSVSLGAASSSSSSAATPPPAAPPPPADSSNAA